MAVFTINTTNEHEALRVLESLAVTNAAATTTVTKAVRVPGWARTCHFLLNVTVMGGSSPLLDFGLQTVDPTTLGTTHVGNLGDWDGITQLTGAAAPVLVTVDVGPNIVADDTGSATASCRYGVCCSLPAVIVYYITYDGTTHDEDYTATLQVLFRG